MSRKIDPAEALEMLKKHQSNFDRIRAAENADNLRWQREIAMLERRVQSLYEEIDLGNGDTIAVRTALSEEEVDQLNEIEKRLKGENLTTDERNELAYQQLELLTANPYLTAEWFRTNRDKWPVMDGLEIILRFAESQMKRRKERFNAIQQFRYQ